MRITRQRKIILGHLRALRTHPTADELFPGLKRELPRLSLGSLYRNLDALTREGMIAKMEGFGPAKRYDGDLEPHLHFQCVECGAVSDYENPAALEINERLRTLMRSQPDLHSVKIDFTGLCDKCRVKRKEQSHEEKSNKQS